MDIIFNAYGFGFILWIILEIRTALVLHLAQTLHSVSEVPAPRISVSQNAMFPSG